MSLGIPSWPEQNSQLESRGANGRSGPDPCREHSLSSCGNIFKWDWRARPALPTGSRSTHASGACLSVFKLPPPLPSQILPLSTWEPATPFHDRHYSLPVRICLRSLSALGDHAKLLKCSPRRLRLDAVRPACSEDAYDLGL